MQNLILSFILLVIGCGSNQSESVEPCIIGTFGSNAPLSAYSADEIKSNNVSSLEKQLTFRDDGTGFYYVPVIKNQHPEFRVDFTYTYKNDLVELTATKLLMNGVEAPNDGVNKPEVLLENRLKFYKLFSARTQEVNCSCVTNGLQTKFTSNTFTDSGLNGSDRIFEQNKISDVASWIRRK